MAGRRLVWSNEEVRELTKHFVLATDEVWRLQGGFRMHEYEKDGGDDPECLSFQALAAKGHYGPGGGSKQGIYVCTPAGRHLASVNSNSAERVARMMREGLAAWKALSETARAASVGFDPGHRWEWSRPKDGLILEETLRHFATREGREVPTSVNRDHVWFTADEIRATMPSKLVDGAEHRFSGVFFERLARHHLLDSARGESRSFAAGEVSGSITMRVIDVRGGKARLRFDGTSRAAAGERRAGTWRPKSIDATLAGHAVFDVARRGFDSFELVGKGTVVRLRRDGTTSTRTIGWLFTTAEPDGPSAKIPPTHIRDYDAAWVKGP